MSNPDSFLEEVTEEVRRDQLIRFFRRNALWIGLALVIIIGGAGVHEWMKARDRAAAQARGDAIFAALDADTPEARLAALKTVEVPGADGEAFMTLERAAMALAADDRDTAVEMLRGVASAGEVSTPLRDVARMKLVAVGDEQLDAQERLDILERLIADGHAMRGLALEQRALVHLEQGDREAAIADLREIGNDGRAPQTVRNRAEDMLMVLGAPTEAASAGGTGGNADGGAAQDG